MSSPELETQSGPNIRRKLVAVALAAAAVIWASKLIPDAERPTLQEQEDAIDTSNPATTTTMLTPPSVVDDKNKPLNDYVGVACSSSERTIKAGDTIYDLSVAGIEDNKYFRNQVFAWQLNNLKEQAKENPELANPDNIQIGAKFQLLGNCVLHGSVSTVTEYPNGDLTAKPTRRGLKHVTFQNYQGADGEVHHDVRVVYTYDKEAHKYTGVYSCTSGPNVRNNNDPCLSYVSGAPEQNPWDE
jgi:hypothetical protein